MIGQAEILNQYVSMMFDKKFTIALMKADRQIPGDTLREFGS